MQLFVCVPLGAPLGVLLWVRLWVCTLGSAINLSIVNYKGNHKGYKCVRCLITKRYDHIFSKDPCVCKVCHHKSKKAKSEFIPPFSKRDGNMLSSISSNIGPDDSMSQVGIKRSYCQADAVEEVQPSYDLQCAAMMNMD